MKKNLFLLFSIYFFVVQAVIAGWLRNIANFYILGIINLVAILLISIVHSAMEKKADGEDSSAEKIIREPKITFHEQHHASVPKRKNEKGIGIFVITLLVVIGLFLLFQSGAMTVAVALFLALILGFILYIILVIIIRHRLTKGFRKLMGTKIYINLLIISIIFGGIAYLQAHLSSGISFRGYLLNKTQRVTDDTLLTGQGTVLGTGLTTGETASDLLSDVFSGTTEDTSTDTTTPTSGFPADQNITMLDAIKYLLTENSVPLVTTKDVYFPYMSYSDTNYPIRRTAYSKSLMGKNTSPTKFMLCDTYIVMKGLLEGRDVAYTKADVLAKFRTAAVAKGQINGCVKNAVVKGANL